MLEVPPLIHMHIALFSVLSNRFVTRSFTLPLFASVGSTGSINDNKHVLLIEKAVV